MGYGTHLVILPNKKKDLLSADLRSVLVLKNISTKWPLYTGKYSNGGTEY